MNISKLKSHVILSCQAAAATVAAEQAQDAHGASVLRISTESIVPQRARDICQAALPIVAKSCRIDASQLSLAIQASPGVGAYSGRLHGGVVLLLAVDTAAEHHAALDDARAAAAAFVDLLAAKRAQPTTANAGENSAASGASITPISLNDLADSALWGARIPTPLDLIVPGHCQVRLTERIKRRDFRMFTQEKLTVLGNLRAVVVGGRGHRLFVRGVHQTSNAKFGDHAVSFSESQRSAVASALSVPGQRVLLEITEERLDEGTAKPRIKRVLDSIQVTTIERDRASELVAAAKRNQH